MACFKIADVVMKVKGGRVEWVRNMTWQHRRCWNRFFII